MTIHTPAGLVRRLLDGVNRQNVEQVCSVFAAGYNVATYHLEIDTTLTLLAEGKGIDTVRAHWKHVFEVYPDFRVQVHSIVSDRDGLVRAILTWHYTKEVSVRACFCMYCCCDGEDTNLIQTAAVVFLDPLPGEIGKE